MIIINGKSYTGNNVSIFNGVVTIDGKPQGHTVYGAVEIRITEGTLASLTTDASVVCGDVAGDVKANGPVTCDNVGGNVNANGPVTCDDIGGNVSAMGPVIRG